MTALPLLLHPQADDLVAWHQGQPVRRAAFIGQAMALAAQLPAGRPVVNLCEDRYHFLLGFAAALINRQVSLLPPNRTPAAIRQTYQSAAHAFCLVDRAEDREGLAVFHMPAALAGRHAGVPAFPPDQPAAVLYTSGSTGTPEANAKTWGALVDGAQALGRQMGWQAAARQALLGTVPPQHMFGLETTVMLPLQQGWPVAARQPFFPADIQQAGEQLGMPYWLMTTPLHLKACVLEKLQLPGLCGVISSTMPLGAELAAAAEAIWNVPVHEIYGCTEAGMMATRRPATGNRLRLADDLTLQAEMPQGFVLSGRRITGGRLALADRISVHNAREFTLHGRASHLVKVAGKRMALEALNQALLRVPGVRDGIFFDPAPELDNHGRLIAFVVAPDIAPAQILNALREQVDAVFLPRPLLLVDALPRTDTGKLPRSLLVALAQHKLQGAPHE